MPSSSSSSSLVETAAVVCAAAAVSTYIVIESLKCMYRYEQQKEEQRYETAARHYYPPYVPGPTFFANHRTRSLPLLPPHHGVEDSSNRGGGHPDDDDSESALAMATSRGMGGGFSMKEAAMIAKEGKDKAKARTPANVLQSLQKGNSRFYMGKAIRPEISAFERRVLIQQQYPATAVLGCSDSRVPVEIVFDQGLGDMFVVRVAGNCLGTLTTCASLEYAIHNLKVKVVLVMGHEGCGAIKAASLPIELIEREPVYLANALKEIKQGLACDQLRQITDRTARDREAVTSNVRNQIVRLCEDDEIMKIVERGELKIVGGFYEISSGIVDFFMQVSHVDLKTNKERKPSPGVQSRYIPSTKEIIYA